ncbi:MAG: TM2 domain-containing membrane protein YozV [Marivirga sp.]|jgi:TM2 domain-containing membrane protein YozV
MESGKVDMFIMTNGKYFEGYQLGQIREKLINLPEEKWSSLQILQFKDPTLMLIVSIFAGHIGIDRFLIGDTGLGIIKLITCGGLGIWTIVDWFLIMGAAKEKNTEQLALVLV